MSWMGTPLQNIRRSFLWVIFSKKNTLRLFLPRGLTFVYLFAFWGSGQRKELETLQPNGLAFQPCVPPLCLCPLIWSISPSVSSGTKPLVSCRCGAIGIVPRLCEVDWTWAFSHKLPVLISALSFPWYQLLPNDDLFWVLWGKSPHFWCPSQQPLRL